jgi:hypothetical protein
MNSIDPVQRQLEAYNAHDLDAFLAQYTEDIRAYRPPAAEPILVGKVAFAAHYAKNRFNIPTLHAKVVNRMAFGNKVVDHEVVTGLGENPVEVAAVYEVRDGLIAAVWFFAAG